MDHHGGHSGTLYSVNQKFKRRKSKSWTDHTGNNRKRRTQFLQGHTGRTWSGIYTVSYDSDPLPVSYTHLSRYVEGYLLTPETVKEAGTAETVTVSQKYAHAWPEIYLDGMGWIPIEVTPKYENIMGTPYYETQETAVSNSSSSDQSLENDDKKKQEKQQEQKKQEKEQTTEKKSEKKTVETPQQIPQNRSKQSKGGRTVHKILYILCFFIFIVGLLLFVFRKRLQKVYRNYKTDKLLKQQKYSQAVMFWYDILCKTIYGKEKIKDNRVRTFEKRLRTFDREVEPKKLHLCMRIRQKAVYSPEGITRKEAEAAVHFLKKECEKLK